MEIQMKIPKSSREDTYEINIFNKFGRVVLYTI